MENSLTFQTKRGGIIHSHRVQLLFEFIFLVCVRVVMKTLRRKEKCVVTQAERKSQLVFNELFGICETNIE